MARNQDTANPVPHGEARAGHGPKAHADPVRTTMMILDALQQELTPLFRRLSEIEQRIARYDRVFEQLFQEEADRRLKGKDGHHAVAELGTIGALEQLKWRLQKEAAEPREA